MFAELTRVFSTLDSVTSKFVQMTMDTRREVVNAHITAGTITAAELRCLIDYKLVVPSASMGLAAINVLQPPLFKIIVRHIKRGWDMLDMVLAPARLHDVGQCRLRNQLTELSRQLRRHGINISSAMVNAPHCAKLMRQVDWRTAGVRAAPSSYLIRVARAGGHGCAGGMALAEENDVGQNGSRKKARTASRNSPGGVKTDAAALAALQDSMKARAIERLVALHAESPSPHIKRMAIEWTLSVALRRLGRANHFKFYDNLEHVVALGGAATARTAAAMVRTYLSDYPGSYVPCTTTPGNPDNVQWGCTRMTVLLSTDLGAAWGGAARVGYCGLLMFRIDWVVLALLLLPAGPSHPSHQQAQHGVGCGTRLGVAVAALACQEVSEFMTTTLTLLACTGYGGPAIADACRTSAVCRENARFVMHARSNADALAMMVAEAGVDAMYAVFRLLSAGVIVGPCAILPAYAPARGCLPPGLTAVLARRFRLPVVLGAHKARLVTAAVCLRRRDIPAELVSIILLAAPYAPPVTDARSYQDMSRIALRGVDY